LVGSAARIVGETITLAKITEAKTRNPNILNFPFSIFNFFYDISEEGNFEEKNIPNIRFTIDDAAKALKLETNDIRAILKRSREKLFADREKRIKPHRDEKILTAWNGLMLAAFAEASAVLQNDDYLSIAERNADFLLTELRRSGRLLRTWKNGTAKLDAYVEDHANLADGLLELFQISGEMRYFDEARVLVDRMIDEFWDTENGGFYFTSNDHEELIVRNKDITDNATPSGNSVAADVLLKLSKITGEEKYERYASNVLGIAAAQAARYPQGFGRALSTMEFLQQPTKEIVLVGDKENELTAEAWREYLPNKVIVRNNTGEVMTDLPLLKDRRMIDGRPTAYVCEKFVCQRPVTTSEELARDLRTE
jgi:uncharacterized protein YyaL (SSP411 family)